MLAATLWLTRILDPSQFGEFRVASSFATLCIPFLALGGERVISRQIQSDRDGESQVRNTIVAVFTITLFGTALLILLFPIIGLIVLDNSVSMIVYSLSLATVPVTIAYNVANTIWRHTGSTDAAQFHLNFLQRVVRAPLLIGMSALWPVAASAAAAMLVAQAASLLHIQRHISQYVRASMGGWISSLRSSIRPMIVVGVPVAVLASIDRIDVLIVNAIMGVDAAGAYDVIFLLSITAMFPAMALAKSSEPHLMEVSAHPGSRSSLHKLQVRSFALSCLGAVAVAVASVPLAFLLGNAGPEFIPATIALSAGLALASSTGPVLEYLQIIGHARMVMITVGILLPAFIGLKALAASLDSLTGVAAMAGAFYFTLRLVLAVHVRITSGFFFFKPAVILGAFALYLCVAAITMFYPAVHAAMGLAT